jgi:hypothetical protein
MSNATRAEDPEPAQAYMQYDLINSAGAEASADAPKVGAPP